MGFDRFGELGWLDATTDEDGLGFIGSCDLRRLLGEWVWAWVFIILSGGDDELDPVGVSVTMGCGLGWAAVVVVIVVVVVAAVEPDSLGPDT